VIAHPAADARRSGSDLLAGPATRTLPRDDDTLDKELGTPDTPRLTPLECRRQACDTDWAVSTHRLGSLDIVRGLGEEHLRVDRQTWNFERPPQRLSEHAVEWAGQHLRHPS
jgi:hypothetical protein